MHPNLGTAQHIVEQECYDGKLDLFPADFEQVLHSVASLFTASTVFQKIKTFQSKIEMIL